MAPGRGTFCQALAGAAMSLGTVLIITLIIFLLRALPSRFGRCGRGMNQSGMGLCGRILIVPAILVPLHNFQAS